VKIKHAFTYLLYLQSPADNVIMHDVSTHSNVNTTCFIKYIACTQK